MLDGPELTEFDVEVESAAGTQWTPVEIQVAGLVRDGRLIVEEPHQ